MALFGVLLERIVIRPILGQPAFSIVMLTIGIGYVARGLITMIPGIGTETHTLPGALQGPDLERRRAGAQRRADGGDRHHRRAVPAAVRRVQVQQDRHRHAGVVAEPAGGLLHGHPGQAAQRPRVGPGRRGGRGRRPAAGADHLRARQHGLHRPEGVPRRGGGRLRQPARRHRRRPDHRHRRIALGLLPARGLQGHRRLHRRADHADGQTERPVRRAAAARKSNADFIEQHAFHLQDRLRARTSSWPSTAATCSGTAPCCCCCWPRPGCSPSTGWRSSPSC